MSVKLQITGGADLVRELRKLDHDIQRRVSRRAVRRAAAPIEAEAKRNAPVRFGHLKESITTKTKVYPNGVAIAVVGPRSDYAGIGGYHGGHVGFRAGKGLRRSLKRLGIQVERPSLYAHLAHDGSKPHAIKAFGGKMIIQHPGARGNKFMVRAYIANKGRSMSIIETELSRAIKRANRMRVKSGGAA